MARPFADSDAARLRIALRRISRLVDRQINDEGLTATQLSVLGTTARLGTVGVGELAEEEGLNPTMLSRVVGKLEAAGLLVRVPNPKDGRAVSVQVSAAGHALQERMRDERTELFAVRLAGLPPAQIKQLLSALPAIEALAEQLRRPAPPARAAQVSEGSRS
ncbi:MAG: putative MarR family transcriptional regulator [Frankiales bacterium]|jgi:DNA-binding MarR family transcriptional regulator|nr:putative MarR family transcriptional regulator [Frankiales bacterium]